MNINNTIYARKDGENENLVELCAINYKFKYILGLFNNYEKLNKTAARIEFKGIELFNDKWREYMKNIEGLLIKKKREKLGLKQEYICKGICSISYLSKIEKGNISASNEIIGLLFQKLGIKYNNDSKFIKNGKDILDYVSRTNYFGLTIDDKVLEDIIYKREEYLNSPLYIDYRLFELSDKRYDIKDIDIIKYREYMTNDQLYKAYFLTGFIKEDINMLENAKRIKETAEVVNRIAYVKWIKGKYYESIEIYLEALSLANIEGNIKEQIDICTMLGNIYMDIDIHTMQKYYDKALLLSNFSHNDEFKFLIYYHMGIAYTLIDFEKSELYLLEALRFCHENDKISLEKLYQKLCFLYLLYDKRKDVKYYYNKTKEINVSEEVNELIAIMIENKNYISSNFYLNKLLDIYNHSKENNKHSDTKYYGDFLIEAYKSNRKYKYALEVTDYLYRI